jgi:hypothetical protein
MLLLEKGRRNWFFFFFFLMLDKSKPMTNYENMNKLFHFLDVKNFPKITHWSNVVC